MKAEQRLLKEVEHSNPTVEWKYSNLQIVFYQLENIMAVEWTAHRFAAGVLALDLANTMVLRIDPARCFDRFDDPREIGRFADVASVLRADELHGRRLEVRDSTETEILRLREVTDGLFRDAVERERLESQRLSHLLQACSTSLEEAGPFSTGGVAQSDTVPLEAASAMSAISLLQPERLSRIRICANCGWLFFDRSRNGSRIWCDMAVCGNRRKAVRHYRRSRESGASRC